MKTFTIIQILEAQYSVNGYTATATKIADDTYKVEFTNGETTDEITLRVTVVNNRPRVDRIRT
jgi:hypothetical protein